jgi:ABC-2 type transport system permease protein
MSATRAPSAPPPISRWRVFLALLRRDARVMRRELASFLISTTFQPLLFTIVFGFLMPNMGLVQGFYVSALLPGILAISVSIASLQTVALPMVAEFGLGGEIEDRLLAPVPIELIAHEKMVMGVLHGILTALFVFPLTRLIMGPVPGLTLAHGGMAVAVLILGCAAFSALGMVLGTAISPSSVSVLFSAIVGPMMFFGCAYHPWQGLSVVPAMKIAVLANPLVYLSEGLRGTLTPDLTHMNLAISMSALGLIAAAFWALGLRTFARRAIR